MNSECGISNQKEQDTNQICLEDDFFTTKGSKDSQRESEFYMLPVK
jgi:hypothetical protein